MIDHVGHPALICQELHSQLTTEDCHQTTLQIERCFQPDHEYYFLIQKSDVVQLKLS